MSNLTITQAENKEMARAIKLVTDNKALKPLYESMRDTYAGLVGNEILGRFDLGESFDKVLQPENESTYGTSAASNLASALNIKTPWLYACSRVSRTWSRAEIEKIANRTSKQGKKVNWSHLDLLTHKDLSKRDRNSILAKFFNEGLRVEDIKDLIEEKLGASDNGRGGKRTTVLPRSPQAALRQLSKATQNLLTKNEAWSTMFFDKIEQNPDDFADADLVEEIQTALDEQRQLEEISAANKRRLQTALTHVQLALEPRNPTQTPAVVERTKVGRKKKKRAADNGSDTRVGRKKKKAASPPASSGSAPRKKRKARSPSDAIAAARKASEKKKKLREPVAAA